MRHKLFQSLQAEFSFESERLLLVFLGEYVQLGSVFQVQVFVLVECQIKLPYHQLLLIVLLVLGHEVVENCLPAPERERVF